jgi:glutaredoxin 3
VGPTLQSVRRAGDGGVRPNRVPVLPEMLKRVRATPQQVGLDKTERAADVQGAFKVAPERRPDVAGRRLILVDDVLTSGATVDACARALLRAGAAHVDVLVFARLWREGGRPYNPLSGARNMASVEIYTSRYCPYCVQAKALLKRKGVEFTEIDLGREWKRKSEMIERAHGRMTVPQIFVGATHVGGCDDLYALDEAGKLDPLLAAEGAVS